jgi:hypothetical protein
MPRTLLPQIEKCRTSRLLSIGKNGTGQLSIVNAPPTKSAGFYWIYTTYSQAELAQQAGPGCRKAVDIGFLSKLHSGLANTCTIQHEGFSLVYNGIAGVRTGLRERIHQHFNGGQGTGSLAILRTCLNDLHRWRISYATIETSNQQEPDVRGTYDEVAEHVERIWRLEYGWPVLCTR